MCLSPSPGAWHPVFSIDPCSLSPDTQVHTCAFRASCTLFPWGFLVCCCCTLVCWLMKPPGAGSSQAHWDVLHSLCLFQTPAAIWFCSEGFVFVSEANQCLAIWLPWLTLFHSAFVDFTHWQLCWLLLPAAQGQPGWTFSYVKCIEWGLLGWRSLFCDVLVLILPIEKDGWIQAPKPFCTCCKI